ncbi:Hypothetical protein, putative [Bodo saltans]|uniref:Uncharacterized protein n=1 Tax=Bodo saltans TaxID=75058 RepID=A0A0S4JGD9_BODSA|nr:Hypothetical protein, putative [Bodo saltans]|eukprot:CUG89176.1 Hypothetical protein, putative [Bodo saltans]
MLSPICSPRCNWQDLVDCCVAPSTLPVIRKSDWTHSLPKRTRYQGELHVHGHRRHMLRNNIGQLHPPGPTAVVVGLGPFFFGLAVERTLPKYFSASNHYQPSITVRILARKYRLVGLFSFDCIWDSSCRDSSHVC